MIGARLEVNDGLGSRVLVLDKPLIAIGRRGENDLRLVGSDVSRDHAEIAQADERLVGDFSSTVATLHRQVSGIRYQVSGIRYQVSGIRRFQHAGIRDQ